MTEARDVLLGPIEAKGATEQIVRRLGEAIGSGVLKPGERLPAEADLARMLDVAPMTLRQALAALRDAGYITTTRGRTGGSFVSERPLDSAPLLTEDELPTTQELRNLTDWRRAVSGEAAALAAKRCKAANRRTLQAAEAVAAQRTGDPNDYRLADSALHVAIAEVSQSARLIAAEAQIQIELSEMLRTIPRPKVALTASHKQHLPLLQAIYDKDADRARALTIEHVEGTYDWLLGLRLGRFKPSR